MCFYVALHLIKMGNFLLLFFPQTQHKLYPAAGERNQTLRAMPSRDKISKDFS